MARNPIYKGEGLEFAITNMSNESTVNVFFDNLDKCLRKYDILDKPNLIYNADEKGVTIDHKPPHVISSEDFKPQAVTSGKGQQLLL
ncbi:hypothetical protein DPMN_109100 [Dreissena polymorpha]|uniref:Uncharacterized protein n=1 Tax=Dreissena polymorpha TaxID=45954 RepID=A0A9D4QLU6_DREPO|nr:hypothetical protein DPMN_109100 [Dreissena polymorpha]